MKIRVKKKGKRIDRRMRYSYSKPSYDASVPFGRHPIGLRQRTWLLYKTSSGNTMDMCLDVVTQSRESLPVVPEIERINACGPCKGYNGGCPGYAPRVDKFPSKYDHAVIMWLHIDMAWAIHYGTPNTLPGKGRSRPFRHLRYADRLTDNLMHRIRKATKEVIGKSISLSLGNCEGCSSTKQCTVIQGEKCRNPKDRTFSVEATGIDVDELFRAHYGERMPWYMKTTYAIPTYMSRCMIFFTDHELDWQDLVHIETAVTSDKYLVGVGHRPFPLPHRPVFQKALIVEPNFDQMLWIYLDPPVTEHHNFKLVRKLPVQERAHEAKSQEGQAKGKKKGRRQEGQAKGKKAKVKRTIKIKRRRR